MSLPAYLNYQDSGTTWLGKVPVHWTVRRLGYFFDERREKVSDRDYQPLSVTKSGIVPQLETAAKTDDGDNRKLVRVGDFVINSRSDRKGSAGASALDGSVSLINTVLCPTSEIDIGFAHHLLRSVPFQEEYYRYGKGIVADLWSTNYSEMRNITLAVPGVLEQRAIASFLDRETGKTDALIAEQEKLLTLLAEKRRETISHAVTRGLNPDVPMKDSGVVWLGKVPSHWEIGAVKRFFVSCDGRRVPLSAEERGRRLGEYPYYGASGVIDHVDDFIFDEDLVLVSEDGANLLNRSTPIAFIARGKYWVNNHAHILQPSDDNLVFWSERIEAINLEPFVTGSAQPKLTIEALMNLVISVPPTKEERAAISDFIVSETVKLDALKAKTEHAVELLKERRKALIAAAVTGKIDVRNAVSQELAA
ncbi:type I restriction enzyme S subunit [Paraburkholderia atlantica]|uniref:restriction endonuclease subunit S n=1 Tax=Paraburkholderia atlantica TaxID=2654982 RepID=UPI003D242437